MTIIDKPEHADTRNWKFLLKVDDYSSNNVLSVKDLVIGYKNIPLSMLNYKIYKYVTRKMFDRTENVIENLHDSFIN